MKKQMSRQEMFDKIQDLQRELAEGVWQNVELRHHYRDLKSRHDALKEFVFGNKFEVAVGMSIGPDNPEFLSERVVKSLRDEFEKLDEQFNKS